ncbi:ketopantoate reductase family protein [Naasia aerilata]|uniref:2-dehydropantoate 2-reductase n=1 Tax=Naasia aerilata TaxID=1162966 RepID=A0ABM8GH52_9MICO|nr:2-dehydropantoate 2-reductase [Naasia aerilata]BDZ47691.1 2-dehydropantoate 2-reductase [Naasia aerilata]
MRVGVIGAGAVGGALAALLDRSGHRVTVTARASTLPIVAEEGIRLTGGWGEHRARVGVGPVLTEPQDLVLVATKAMDAPEAAAASAAACEGATVVVVQNGLEGVTRAVELLPRSRVLGGLALFAASLVAPGEVRITTPGAMYVGPAERSDPVIAVLNGAVPTLAVSDLRGMQWTKLIVNQVNALPAITGKSVQEVVADAGLRRVLTRSIQEAARVGLASGVSFGSMSGLNAPLLRLVALAPARLAERLPRLMARRMGSVPNPGSTLQSIRRGQPTEIDYLNGAVVDAARAAGGTAPVNAALTTMVHEVEGSGDFLSPGEVVRRVGGD